MVRRVFRDFVIGGDKLPGRNDDPHRPDYLRRLRRAEMPLDARSRCHCSRCSTRWKIPHPIFDTQGHEINERLWQEDSQTAIGDAVAPAANRLEDIKAKSKIMDDLLRPT